MPCLPAAARHLRVREGYADLPDAERLALADALAAELLTLGLPEADE